MIRRGLLRAFGLIGAVFTMGSAVTPAQTQEVWPSRPIRMVVPYPPGGSYDILGRALADHLGRSLNATFIVDNKPGGTTQIGTEFVANAAPDGYTVLLGTARAFTVLPNERKLPFSVDNFELLGGIADYVGVLAVRKNLPVTNMREFVEYARKNPGKLSFGSAGELSAGHVYAATLARDTGIKVLHVPFRGSVDAVNAMVAGDVDFVIDGAATPMVKAGRVTPIAAFYQARHPELPTVPTISEAGFEISMTKSRGTGMFVPKGVPAPIAARLVDALHKAVLDPKMKESFERANFYPAWQAPADFRRTLESDRKFYGELLPQIGVKN